MSDERLRTLYAEARARRAGGRQHCPAPEQLQALAEGRLTDAARLAILDHVFACADCPRELALFRGLADAGAATRPVRRAWFAVAAAVAALATTLLVVRAARQDDETMRGTPHGVELVAPEANAPLPPDRRFVWRAMPGATRYRFELLRDGTPVVSATLTDTVYVMPDSARWMPGAALRWWVRADHEDGTGELSAPRPLAP